MAAEAEGKRSPESVRASEAGAETASPRAGDTSSVRVADTSEGKHSPGSVRAPEAPTKTASPAAKGTASCVSQGFKLEVMAFLTPLKDKNRYTFGQLLSLFHSLAAKESCHEVLIRVLQLLTFLKDEECFENAVDTLMIFHYDGRLQENADPLLDAMDAVLAQEKQNVWLPTILPVLQTSLAYHPTVQNAFLEVVLHMAIVNAPDSYLYSLCDLLDKAGQGRFASADAKERILGSLMDVYKDLLSSDLDDAALTVVRFLKASAGTSSNLQTALSFVKL